MKFVGGLFEVVIFTASLSKYADPVLDLLDIHKVIDARLFREGCVQYQGGFVKDMSRLGRDIAKAVIVDNSPASYLFQPGSAIPIETWFDDPHDQELLNLMPFLKELASTSDVRPLLQAKYHLTAADLY
jgi:RNA polymerase II subunit A small phosphatase-like protein